MTETITTRISTGELAGSRDAHVDRYLAVPYAAPPIGDLRFADPVRPPSWQGVRDATRLGPTAPQNPMSPSSATYLPNVIDPGDDYLHVNVWAPTGGERRPVVVWFHGGSLRTGSNALGGYDGTAFARDGVVLVAVNYRLGIEGFAVLDDAPANLGYADMVAALRWVRREIAAFGGDPEAVTIAGESAGGVAVGNLLASEHAGELFHRAVLQSGMPTGATRAKAAAMTRSIARHLGIETTSAAFADVPTDRLLEAELAVTERADHRIGAAGYVPTIGGRVVPTEPVAAVLDGAGDGIPVLVSWNADEHTFFMLGGAFARISRPLLALVRLRFGVGRRRMRAYRDAYPGATPGLLAAVMSIDGILRIPMHRIADARRARGAAGTWFAELTWPSPVDGLGATHALELGFVFDTLDDPEWTTLTGPNPPQPLADAMHAAWVRFATHGDPGWQPWDASRPTMVLDGVEPRVVDGQRDAQLGSLG